MSQYQNGNVFSARLRELRGDKTKAAFARFLGLKNAPTYQRYEAGRIPNSEILSEIASRCGKSVDWLLGRVSYEISPGEAAKIADRASDYPGGWKPGAPTRTRSICEAALGYLHAQMWQIVSRQDRGEREAEYAKADATIKELTRICGEMERALQKLQEEKEKQS